MILRLGNNTFSVVSYTKLLSQESKRIQSSREIWKDMILCEGNPKHVWEICLGKQKIQDGSFLS